MKTVRPKDVEINSISSDNSKAYFALRATSLSDTSDALGSTYISGQGDTVHLLPVMASYKNIDVGLAYAVVNKQEPQAAQLSQIWVLQKYRGQGIGRILLNYIIHWAKEFQLSYLKLSVPTTNLAIMNLCYLSGFVDDGIPMPLRKGSTLFIQPMALNLQD